MSKARLIKVIVQPFFVIDDGEVLTEENIEPFIVPASKWEDFINNGLNLIAEELTTSKAE